MNTEPPDRTFDYTKQLTPEMVQAGAHRRWVGGKWGRLGKLQLDFMIEQGLQPGHRLLDVGCGALRAGIHFTRYLEPGNYYGIDANESVIDAGYEVELPAKLRGKLPRDHLRATLRFDVDFGVQFDYAVANSVFTHISLNHIRLCLHRLSKAMKPGAKFFATFFEAPDGFPLEDIVPGPRGGRFSERNPFWYYQDDLIWAAARGPWKFRYVGDWGHPVGQMMAEFTRKKDRRRR